MTEQELIDGCRAQKYRAQKQLYRQYSPLMMGLCIRYASGRDVAEDILQDGFIKVFQKFDSFKEDGPLGAWIRRVILNTALQHYRDTKNLRMHVQIDNANEIPSDFEDVISMLSLDELGNQIQRLPDGCRLVFNLYAVEGYKHAEIADQLGISSGTSKSQYSRAKSLLKQMILTEEKVSGQAI